LASGPPARAPRLAARPEARSPKPRTSRGRLEVLPLIAPRGLTGTGRTAGRSSVSPAMHSCRGRRLLLDVAVGLLGRWQAHLSPIKRSPPFSSRPCCGRAAAGDIAGSRDELQARSAAHQSKPSPTFPCTSPSSLACPFPPGHDGHRRWPPAPPPRRSSPCPTKPKNRHPRARGSIPARARPVPAGGSPEFGRTAAGRCSGTPLRSHNSF
jgi:hypothetical protein